MSELAELCALCIPPLERLLELARRALAGEHAVPVVGDGSAGTEFGCEHGRWRLGDLLPELEAVAGPNGCTKPKSDGSPCAGRAGEDGLCAAHKDQP